MSDQPHTVLDNVERDDCVGTYRKPRTELHFDQWAVFEMSNGEPSKLLGMFPIYADAERFVGKSNQKIYRAGLTVDVSQPAEAGR